MTIAELWVTAAPPFNIVPDGTQGTGAYHEVDVGNGKRLVYIRGYRHVGGGFQRTQTVTDRVFIHNRKVDWAEVYSAGSSFRYTNNDQHIRALRIDACIKGVFPKDDIGNKYTEIDVESTYDMEDDQGNPVETAIAVTIVALTSEWGYVIITTNAIKAGSTKLNSFIEHKQSCGFNVLVVTEDDFNGLYGQAPHQRAEKIRQWLINSYQSKGIKYVLLIGNPTPYGPGVEGDIPMKLCKPTGADVNHPENWTPTDCYYANLNGNWDVNGNLLFANYADDYKPSMLKPDVYVGRIPVYDTNYEVLDNILQKIINYENSNDVEWRNNALLPMGFWYPDTDASPLGEALNDHCLHPMGVNYWRMYLKGSGPCGLSSPYLCEEELRGSIGRGPTKVGDRWAANHYGIVCWAGHGLKGYARVSEFKKGTTPNVSIDCNDGFLFTDYECDRLNDNYPAFVFSCSCYNGQPEESGNLMYLLLKKGAVSTVGSSRSTHFPTPLGTKENIPSSWGNHRLAYEYVYELVVNGLPAGVALYEARYNMIPTITDGLRLKSILEYNLYGDPSLSLILHHVIGSV